MSTITAMPTEELVASALPYRPYHVRVARLQRLSPSFLRITFTGDDLQHFCLDGPDQRIKLHLPAPGCALPQLSGADWYGSFRAADPSTRGDIRTYTTRAVRPEIPEVDVDFVLHGATGPASAWAEQACVGQEVALVGPNRLSATERGGFEWRTPTDVADIVLVGDETATPAIAGILETLAAGWVDGSRQPRVRVFLEVPETADVLPLTAPPHAEIAWFPRRLVDGSVSAHGAALLDAVRSAGLDELRVPSSTEIVDVDVDRQILWEVADPAPAGLYAWIAGEAGTVKALRRHLVRDCGIDKRAVTFMGYWRQGRTEDAG